jgi:hypothetical protein
LKGYGYSQHRLSIKRNLYTSFAAASECRAIAIYDLAGFSVGVMGLGRVLVNHICKAFVVTFEPITSEQATNGQRLLLIPGRAMNHLAQANQHIAELTAQIVRQRVIVKYALDTGQRSEMAESLLDALERSLRIFEKHRELVLDQLQRQPVPGCPA